MPKPSLYARARPAFTAAAVAIGILVLHTTNHAQTDQRSAPCAACIVLIAAPGQTLLFTAPLNGREVLVAAGENADGADVRAAIEAIRKEGGRAGLLMTGFGNLPEAGMLGLLHRLVIDLDGDQSDPEDLAFRLKTRLVEVRGSAANLLIGISTNARRLDSLVERDIAAYIDFRAAPDPGGGPGFPGTATYDGPPLAFRAVDASSAGAPMDGWALRLPLDTVAAQQIINDVVRAAPFLKAGLIAGGMAEIYCGTARLPTYLDPETLATVALVPACADGRISVAPETPGVERVTLSNRDVVVRVPAGEGRFAEGVQVVTARKLTVREIIARHQAAVARQRRAVRQLISTGTMTLTFEAPGFPAPLAITTEAVIYTAPDRTEIEQREIRVNGIAFQGGNVPRLPLLEPERVAAPPLAIALTDVYRYSLAGEDDARGVRCYVLSFDPVDRQRSLFSGRVWIAMDSFAMVKVSATQTALRGPIVSSEQTDEFRSESDVWLLDRSDIRQIYEGAGHRTPIHRVLRITRHEINSPEFEARRQSAYASSSVMLRDTAEGFRYLQRQPGAGAVGRVEPTVAGRAERVRTVALGVIIDPNISRPLPFAGLSYVDFNLFGTGTQMNGFFGGTYGQLAIAVPSLGGTRWQLGGRAFGIASSYNDRAFIDGREYYEANITQRPAHASAWLLRPLTSRITARAGYDFDYTHYGAADSTAASFRVPASQAAHALRLGVEGQWAGWSASAWWAGARRAGWREWGVPGDGGSTAAHVPGLGEYAEDHRDFQKFGALLTRSFVASPRLVGRVEAAWMAGRDLDRFSRYSFGSFDNRLRGYPSALIRYDRGAVVRGSAAWAAGRLLRLDGFLDTAFVRDPGFGQSAKNYTGIGAAAEVPAPFGTLIAIEWGYGFQGLDSDGRRGTQVVRISGYKMF